MRSVPMVAWALALVTAVGTAAAQPTPDPADIPETDGHMPLPPRLRHPKTAADFHDVALLLAQLGEVEKSIPFFKKALSLEDNAKYECNFAAALAHLNERARAHARFSRCVTRLAAIAPDSVGNVRAYLATLEAELAKTHQAVEITTTPSSAVITISTWPGDETVTSPTLVWLPPGDYTIIAALPGHVDATATVTVTDDGVAAHKRASVPLTLAASAPTDPDHGTPAPMPPPRRSRKAAKVTLAAGGALAIGGVVVHVLSRGPRAELAGRSGDAYADYLPTWHAYQYGTIGLYAAGAATLAVGAYLYTRKRTPVPMAVAPTGDGSGAMIWLWSP